MFRYRSSKGFSLIEMLLVLAIASSMIVVFLGYTTRKTDQLRIDKAALQAQQVLNAALAFYLNNGRWPNRGSITATHELVTQHYLPAAPVNPWGGSLWIKRSQDNANGPLLYVLTVTRRAGSNPNVNTWALAVSGKLPSGFSTDDAGWWNGAGPAGWVNDPVPTAIPCPTTSGALCSYAVGAVSIPGQNLNNARSVNFASIYNSGACVPEPVCPTGMTSSILVVPVQVFGSFDAPSCTSSPTNDPTTCTQNVYPITGYSAYAYGPGSGGAVTNCSGSGVSPCLESCPSSGPCSSISFGTERYFRVCLSVKTDKGDVSPTGQNRVAWGKLTGSVLAITRCVPTAEPAGSAFSVWAP